MVQAVDHPSQMVYNVGKISRVTNGDIGVDPTSTNGGTCGVDLPLQMVAAVE